MSPLPLPLPLAPNAIATHVEAAKRLLQELEQHAGTALDALGRDNGAEFIAAVNERDRILGQLGEVVEALTKERTAGGDFASDHDAETRSLFTEMTQAAAAALESHEQLAVETRRERDRLAVALQRTKQPDAVANQYAASSTAPRTRTLSVTG